MGLSCHCQLLHDDYLQCHLLYIFPNGRLKKSLQEEQMDQSGRWKKEIIEENCRVFLTFSDASLDNWDFVLF